MEDGLARSLPDVEHGAIAIFNAALAGNVRSSQMASANCVGIFTRGFFQSTNVSFGDDQHMRRRLGIDVLECKRVLVFIDFLCANFSTNNTAEKTIFHARSNLKILQSSDNTGPKRWGSARLIYSLLSLNGSCELGECIGTTECRHCGRWVPGIKLCVCRLLQNRQNRFQET